MTEKELNYVCDSIGARGIGRAILDGSIDLENPDDDSEYGDALNKARDALDEVLALLGKRAETLNLDIDEMWG